MVNIGIFKTITKVTMMLTVMSVVIVSILIYRTYGVQDFLLSVNKVQFYALATGLLMFAAVILGKPKFRLQLNKLDVALITYAIFLTVRNYWSTADQIKTDHYIFLMISLMFYLSAKYFFKDIFFHMSFHILLVVIISFIALHGYLWNFGFFTLDNYIFRSMEFPIKPELLICLLCLGIPSLLSLATFYRQNKGVASLLYLTLVLIIALIFIKDSRYGWGAIVIVSFYVCFPGLIYIWRYTSILPVKLRSFSVITVLFFIVLPLTLIAGIKERSDPARLLSWKISWNLFKCQPVWGAGYGSSSLVYKNGQADYFLNDGKIDSFEAGIAKENNHPLSQLLLIALESGIIGISLWFYIIFICFTQGCGGLVNRQAATTVLLILALGLFSCPLLFFPVQLLLYLNLSAYSSIMDNTEQKVDKVISLSKMQVVLLMVASILMMSDRIKIVQPLEMWKYADRQVPERKYRLYKELYPRLKGNGIFMFEYGKLLFKRSSYSQALSAFELSKKNYSSQELYLMIGDAQKALKQFELARSAYTFAMGMVPGKIYPKFALINLYIETKERLKAVELAHRTLVDSTKVESKEIEELRFALKAYIGEKE